MAEGCRFLALIQFEHLASFSRMAANETDSFGEAANEAVTTFWSWSRECKANDQAVAWVA